MAVSGSESANFGGSRGAHAGAAAAAGESDLANLGGAEAGVWAIVAAAGAGNRFGGAKQFSPLGDRRVLDWTVQGAARWCEGVVVVLPPADEHAWRPPESLDDCCGPVVVVAGGVLRSDSVRCGLSRIPDDAEIVLVHDGARPLAGDGVYERVIEAVRAGADAAVPVIGVTDTIRWRDGGTVDRSRLAAVQTPQAFRADVLRAAHSAGADATDDAALAEAAGATVATVDGDSRNLKITEAHDLVTAEALLRTDQMPASEGVVHG